MVQRIANKGEAVLGDYIQKRQQPNRFILYYFIAKQTWISMAFLEMRLPLTHIFNANHLLSQQAGFGLFHYWLIFSRAFHKSSVSLL